MNNNPNKATSFRANVVYGNPVNKKVNMPRSGIRRHPAKYDNPSWDEIVDKYVAVDIPPLKKKGGKK